MAALIEIVNQTLSQYQPSTIVLMTAGTLIGLYALGQLISAARDHPRGFTGVIFGSLVDVVQRIPGAKGKIQEKKKQMVDKIKKGMKKLRQDVHL